MTEIPTWWLVASGIFFILNTLLFIVLGICAVFLLKFVTGLKPKIESLESSIQGLVTKVHGVADRVEEVAASVKTTVEGVGGRAKSVVGSAELVAQSASRQFERFSPFVIGAMTAIRLVKALSDARAGMAEKVAKKTGRKVQKTKDSLLGTVLHLLGR